MSCHSIVRIGPSNSNDGCCTTQLRSSLLNYFATSSSTDEGGDTKNDLHRLDISNRYFDASVVFAGLSESADDIITPSESTVEDGIILVFDSSPTASQDMCFNSLNKVHDETEKSTDLGDLLRLCVGVSFGPSPLADGTKASEEEYSRRVLWCLDRGYEYVEADMSPIGIESGHNDRDKEGFARIIEAISSCMWSSRVMKKRTAVTTTSAAAANNDANNDTEKANANADNATKSDPNSDAEREKAAVANLMEGVDRDVDFKNPTDEIRQQEMAFHELERVIADAKNIRESTQNDSMSDEERRKRAGDTALRMMELFDKLGLGDDEEDSDETEASSLPDGVE
mmetsp:Transcript_19047/g.29787  ORF Transcript_19047/g.29787 Transcript_19047/m.29787 type:complete len:341 (-) Transcript_19047:81-1103(-)